MVDADHDHHGEKHNYGYDVELCQWLLRHDFLLTAAAKG
jgi:hypothetical protein